MSADSNPRSLPLLRAMIDALDRELLQLAAQRMAVVAEVAAYKRQHGHARARSGARARVARRPRARRGGAGAAGR